MSQTSNVSDMDISDSDEEIALTVSEINPTPMIASEIIHTTTREPYTESIQPTRADPTSTPWVTSDSSVYQQQQNQQSQQLQQYQAIEQSIAQPTARDNWDYSQQEQQQDHMDVRPVMDGPLAVDHGFPYLIDLRSDSDANSSSGKPGTSEDGSSGSESIEDLYGPFPFMRTGNNHNSGSPYDSPSNFTMGSPRPHNNNNNNNNNSNKSSHLVTKQLEIERLKLMIAQREQEKAKKERQIIQQQQQIAESSASSFSTNVVTASAAPISTSSTAVVNNAVKDTFELKRSIDAMDREIDESKAELAAAIDEEKQQEHANNNSSSQGASVAEPILVYDDEEEEDDDDDDEDDDDLQNDDNLAVVSNIERQMEDLRQAIAKHDSRLKELEKLRSDVQLKAMGLQIRISATENKKFKESRGARTSSTAGSKYDHMDGAKGKRPMEYDRRDVSMESPSKRPNAYGFPSIPPTVSSIQHDMHVLRTDESPIRTAGPPQPFQQLPRYRFPEVPSLPPIHIPKPRIAPPPPPPPPPPQRQQSPPPPPPPPAPPNRTYTPSPPAEAQVHPIADAMKLGTYLLELEGLIKIRFLSDSNATQTTRTGTRIAPRPSRMITVDDFTLSLDSVLLRKHTGSTLQPEITENDLAFDSILYNIIQRFDTLPSSKRTILEGIVGSLPADVRQILESRQYGNPSFANAKQLAQEAAKAHPEMELLWGLFAELTLYCHGPTSNDFISDISSINRFIPFTADVIWQKIRASSKQEQEFTVESLLKDLARRRAATQNSAEARRISGIITEILLRVLRFFGFEFLHYLLTGNRKSERSVISNDIIDIFSLETVQLEDHDIYVVWMTLVYYLLFQRMPDSICRHWYASLLTNGKPSINKPMFTIDWAATAAQIPLSRQEQLTSLNVLLSMLRHFSKKARGNGAKRPLLMGVWQTLLNLLTHCECYRRAGTLTLLRGGLDVEALQPEIYDMAAYLETQMGDRVGALQRLQSHTAQLSMSHRFLLAYRSAHNLGLTQASSHGDMKEAARLVRMPMEAVFNLSDIPSEQEQQEDIVYIDFVRRLYLSALGLDPTPPAPTKKSFKSNIRHSAFAWINLMFLTQISMWIHSELMHAMFVDQLESARDCAMDAVKSDEANLLIFKYASECLRFEKHSSS